MQHCVGHQFGCQQFGVRDGVTVSTPSPRAFAARTGEPDPRPIARRASRWRARRDRTEQGPGSIGLRALRPALLCANAARRHARAAFSCFRRGGSVDGVDRHRPRRDRRLVTDEAVLDRCPDPGSDHRRLRRPARQVAVLGVVCVVLSLPCWAGSTVLSVRPIMSFARQSCSAVVSSRPFSRGPRLRDTELAEADRLRSMRNVSGSPSTRAAWAPGGGISRPDASKVAWHRDRAEGEALEGSYRSRSTSQPPSTARRAASSTPQPEPHPTSLSLRSPLKRGLQRALSELEWGSCNTVHAIRVKSGAGN